MIVSLEVVLASLAALFAYLSWKRASIGDTFEREEVTRNRLKDSVQASDYYQFQVTRLQIAEYGGWGYKILKYFPILGVFGGKQLLISTSPLLMVKHHLKSMMSKKYRHIHGFKNSQSRA